MASTFACLACRERGRSESDTPAAEARSADRGAPSAWPKREATLREVENTRRALEVLVHGGVTDPEDPWCMAHGLVAFGPDLEARDGRLAVDALVADHIRSRQIDGEVRWFFPARTASGKPLEAHDDLVAKLLVTSGLPLDRSFALGGERRVTLQAIVDSVAARFDKPTTAHAWARRAFGLRVLFETHLPGTKIELEGWSPTFSELVVYTIEALGRLQSFLEEPMKENRPDRVEKRKQGIYGHTCGGLHFVQAAVDGANRLGADEPLHRVRKQLELARFRFEAERRIYRETLAEAPRYRTLILVQELKFYGHLLETFGLAAEWGAITPTKDLRTFAHELAGDLVDTVRELETDFAQLEAYRSRSSQTYYDLIGDGCHAIRGLRLAADHFFEDDE